MYLLKFILGVITFFFKKYCLDAKLITFAH